MADNKRLLSLVGLATRARKVVSGEFSTEKSVKSGRSHLVIVSEEALTCVHQWNALRRQ